MRNLIRVGLIFIFVVMLTGCGTLMNVGNPVAPPSHGDQNLRDDNFVFHVNTYPQSRRDKIIFGGVMNDFAIITDSDLYPLWPFTIIDIPLSLAGDVITLPFTVYWSIIAKLPLTSPPLTRLVALDRTGEVQERLKSSDVNVDQRNDKGWTLLMIAAKNHSDEMVKLLLEHGANVNATTKDGKTPLIIIASRNFSLHSTRRIVRMLLERGANVNATTDGGRTPLMMAALNEHPQIVKTLLKHNTPVNAQDKNGDTALIIASRHCDEEIVRILLENGADVSIENDVGNSALQVDKGDARKHNNCLEVNELLKE